MYLNRALRDRFVCGLNHENIQNRLLNTADLTFKLACETARAMEMAEQQAKEFVPGSAVHKVDKQQPWKRQGDTRGNEQRNGDTCVMSRATRRATRRASLGSGVGTVIDSSTSRPTATGRMPFATSVSSRVISSLLVRLRCRTRTKRVKPMYWRTRSRRARPKDTLQVPVLRTTCFLSPQAEVLRRGK